MNIEMKELFERKEMKLRILVTGGRAPATLDLVRQLNENGHHIFIAESCSVHLCEHSRSVVRSFAVPEANKDPSGYITALINIIKAEQIDWLLPTCEEIFFIARGYEHLKRYCNVFVDSYDKLKKLHHKWIFIERTKLHQLSVPETHLLISSEKASAFLVNEGKWVFKPAYSRSSSKVFMLQIGNQGQIIDLSNRKRLLSRTTVEIFFKDICEKSPWIAQRFIEGTSYCSYSIAKKGELVAHALYPVTFKVGQGACISFEAIHHPEIEEWVKRFVTCENFSGQIAFDFIVSLSGDIYAIECNPRATSGLHLFKTEDRLDYALFAETNEILRPQHSRKVTIFLAMLSYGLLSVRSLKECKEWFFLIMFGRDSIFRFNDPQPFFQQFRLLWWNYKLSKQENITLLEATTYDIEWNGEE